MNVVVRSSGDPAVARRRPVRDAIRALDPDLPIYDVRTMSRARRRVAGATPIRDAAADRLRGAAPLGLAAIGIYGVVAYLVGRARARSASGWRSAPRRGRSYGWWSRHGLSMAAAGVAAGIAGAFVLTRFMRSLLFGIAPSDPVTFGMIVVMLGLVALVASYVPARRAAQLDPMLALRAE